jgi:hypothetical protein
LADVWSDRHPGEGTQARRRALQRWSVGSGLGRLTASIRPERLTRRGLMGELFSCGPKRSLIEIQSAETDQTLAYAGCDPRRKLSPAGDHAGDSSSVIVRCARPNEGWASPSRSLMQRRHAKALGGSAPGAPNRGRDGGAGAPPPIHTAGATDGARGARAGCRRGYADRSSDGSVGRHRAALDRPGRVHARARGHEYATTPRRREASLGTRSSSTCSNNGFEGRGVTVERPSCELAAQEQWPRVCFSVTDRAGSDSHYLSRCLKERRP